MKHKYSDNTQIRRLFKTQIDKDIFILVFFLL